MVPPLNQASKHMFQVIGIGKELGMRIGQREELSNIDIAQLRDMYNCNDKEDDDAAGKELTC